MGRAVDALASAFGGSNPSLPTKCTNLAYARFVHFLDGFEQDRGRENSSFPVSEGRSPQATVGKPRVSELFE